MQQRREPSGLITSEKLLIDLEFWLLVHTSDPQRPQWNDKLHPQKATNQATTPNNVCYVVLVLGACLPWVRWQKQHSIQFTFEFGRNIYDVGYTLEICINRSNYVLSQFMVTQLFTPGTLLGVPCLSSQRVSQSKDEQNPLTWLFAVNGNMLVGCTWWGDAVTKACFKRKIPVVSQFSRYEANLEKDWACAYCIKQVSRSSCLSNWHILRSNRTSPELSVFHINPVINEG